MTDKGAPEGEALSAVVNEMLVMADEIESQAESLATALEKLGQERAAQIRRKAYEMHVKLHR